MRWNVHAFEAKQKRMTRAHNFDKNENERESAILIEREGRKICSFLRHKNCIVNIVLHVVYISMQLISKYNHLHDSVLDLLSMCSFCFSIPLRAFFSAACAVVVVAACLFSFAFICFHSVLSYREKQLCFFDVTLSIEIACDSIV